MGLDWHSVLEYTEDSSTCLVWRVGSSNRVIKSGQRAGRVGGSAKANTQYYLISYKKVRYQASRVIWEMFHGAITDGMVIDHLDGNGMNNRISNLSLKTTRQNAQNKFKQKNNSSGVTGVYLNRKMYKGKEIIYWMASWTDLDCVQRTKCFRIDHHGDVGAFDLACKHRATMIDSLKQDGLGYTDRHGEVHGNTTI